MVTSILLKKYISQKRTETMGIARPCGITIIKDKLLEDRILNLKILRKYKAFTGVVKCTYDEANASLPDIFRTAAGMAG